MLLRQQRPDLRRAQQLIGSLLLHDPVLGPRHGRRDTRQDAHRGTPRTSRLLRTRRQVVSQSSSVRFDGSGQLDRERNVDQSVNFGVTRFLKTSKLRQWSMDQGNLMSETARTHRLGRYLKSRDRQLSRNISKKSVITNSMQVTQKKGADSYKDTYGDRNWNFVKLINKVLQEAEELRKFQSSTFDTIARRKLIEDQNTIMELSRRLQELQNEVNCMNDSKDFQDAESVRSGNSHVTSQPGVFLKHPPFQGMLRPSFISQRQTEEPPNIRDTSGISGNVFAHPQASSSAPYPQELHQWNSSIEEPLHSSTVEKSERPEQNQVQRCQSGPSAKNSVIFSGGDSSKNYGGRPTTIADFGSSF